MADTTLIARPDHTFNIAWGCSPHSPGRKSCAAEGAAGRWNFLTGRA